MEECSVLSFSFLLFGLNFTIIQSSDSLMVFSFKFFIMIQKYPDSNSGVDRYVLTLQQVIIIQRKINSRIRLVCRS